MRRGERDAGVLAVGQVLRALPDTGARRHLLDVLAGRGESGWRAEEPGTALFHLHEAVAETLRECAAEQPLLLVVDDLHVADASSLQLLAHLAPALHRLPILLLGTLRPELAGGDPAMRETLALLANERGADRIRLGSFTAADIAAYLSSDAPGGNAPGEVVLALLERTGGNPFYLKELLRLLDLATEDEIQALAAEAGPMNQDQRITLARLLRLDRRGTRTT